MFKQSLTFITVFLLAILSSCAGSNNNFKKNFLTENDIRETINNNELKLNYSINNKNKEYFISSLLESGYKFNIVFDDDGKKLSDRLTESNLSFFCNSFLDDQLYQLENILFYQNNSKEKLIVVFSNEYKNRVIALEKKYPEVKFFLISNNLDAFAQQVTGIESSIERHNSLELLDRNITINHKPRERKDFNKIFFLTDYDIGKSLVPIFRNYLISTEFYSTTELLMGASSSKALNDFKDVMIPVPHNLFKEILLNKDIKNIEDGLNEVLVKDLIIAEGIYQNNISNINIIFNSGISKVSKGQCINRYLPLWKISSDTINSL
ncbi:hypothetical protein OAT47_03155 [Gammaproteobacteria bacterium]|nr:hypothetical protein [Gammaproteobacteria bacterium]